MSVKIARQRQRSVSPNGSHRAISGNKTLLVASTGGLALFTASLVFFHIPFSSKVSSSPVPASLALSRTQTAHSGYIVRLSPSANHSDVLATIARLGMTVKRDLPIIHSLAVVSADSQTNAAIALKAIPGIQHVSPDLNVRKTDEFTVTHTGADVAYAPPSSGGYGLTGKNVGVAVIDSGVRLHADFAGGLLPLYRIVNSPPFLTGIKKVIIDDGLGHGTHIAGIIAGNGLSSSTSDCYRTFYGIARQATIINVPVLDDQGVGAVSDVIAGINWTVQNRKLFNIRVINLSLGHDVVESYQTDPLNQAVEAAWKAGIVVVCSAGNEGRISDTLSKTDNEGYGTNYGSIQCPGNDPYVITVGATKNIDNKRADDRIATYSSRGPSRIDMTMKPDIVAPGNQVISTLAYNTTLDNAYGGANDIPVSSYRRTNSGKDSKAYFVLSGTSMAAPVVAGAAALMLEKDPSLSPDTIKARLMVSADKWTLRDGSSDVFTFGSGYLNIPAALNSKVTVSGMYATSPFVLANEDGTISLDPNHLLFGITKSIWNSGAGDYGAVYGSQALWGGNNVKTRATTFNSVDAVQSNQAIWGRGTSTSSVDLSSVAIFGE